jgi:hypothetical protein
MAQSSSARLHDVGQEIERVYFPHSGMVSLVGCSIFPVERLDVFEWKAD